MTLIYTDLTRNGQDGNWLKQNLTAEALRRGEEPRSETLIRGKVLSCSVPRCLSGEIQAM